ncbi:MAG: polymer-forming cytoskeletal protein, partial [Leptonema sp. (in: Bacteria)]|nr:polymer-forming cytoskeletal protein [Leptonema sp. (in: bacteria)]
MAIVKTASDVTNSTIGENSYFSGRFFINGSLKIDGKFEGKSLQADQLYIGATGRVKTNITATSVIVEGIIVGNITARNRVMLLPTARILGDISTPELIIQNGVILEGRCMISNDLKHSAKDYINAEYNR